MSTVRLEAAIVISGQHDLLPDQPNQVISILASPSSANEVAPGLNLNFVIDDGGVVAGGVDGNSPTITAIDLKPAGGLFASIPDSQSNVFQSPKLFQVTIAPTNVADRPTITSNVLLAEVTLDTTGFSAGNWVIDLDGIGSVGLPSTDFAGLPTSVENGSVRIVVVPEPSAYATMVVLGCVGWTRRRRC